MNSQSYGIGPYDYFIEKIGKSASDLISDRQQQVVLFVLLADTMEHRISFLFVSKNKYGSDACSMKSLVIEIILKSCYLNKLTANFLFYF